MMNNTRKEWKSAALNLIFDSFIWSAIKCALFCARIFSKQMRRYYRWTAERSLGCTTQAAAAAALERLRIRLSGGEEDVVVALPLKHTPDWQRSLGSANAPPRYFALVPQWTRTAVDRSSVDKRKESQLSYLSRLLLFTDLFVVLCSI